MSSARANARLTVSSLWSLGVLNVLALGFAAELGAGGCGQDADLQQSVFAPRNASSLSSPSLTPSSSFAKGKLSSAATPEKMRGKHSGMVSMRITVAGPPSSTKRRRFAPAGYIA